MNPRTFFCAACSGLALAMAPMGAVEITLPVETAQLRESPLPGYALASALCVTCHSVDYVQTQPVSSRAWWKSSVTKMQKTFGAPIPDEAVEPLVDYLVKTYGTERAAAASSSGVNAASVAVPATPAPPARK